MFELAVFFDGRFDLAQGLGDLLVFFVVVEDFGQGELRLHVVVVLLHLFEAIEDHVPALRAFRVLDQGCGIGTGQA